MHWRRYKIILPNYLELTKKNGRIIDVKIYIESHYKCEGKSEKRIKMVHCFYEVIYIEILKNYKILSY